LIAELQTLSQIPDAVAHLWSLIPNELTQSPNQFFEQCQTLGFYSLLFLTQSLSKQDITQLIDILVVTNDTYDVTGVERLNPEKVTILGMCKVIPQEYPNINCRSIDVVSPSSTVQENQLINQLLLELTANPFDLAVAYRGHHRWIQTFEPFRWNCTHVSYEPLSIAAKTRLREEGVYLITGGLGGIGLELAEYLTQTVKAKLILMGSSAFPKRDEWNEWLLTHDEQDEVSCKIQKVQELEKLGAEVLTTSADVANEAQMEAVMTQAIEHFGQINGVIHAAGIKLFRTIQEISKSECEKQLRANGHGLFILEKVLQGIELDFCLLISSVSSVLGALGMAAYPAAHLFADAFVSKHNQTNSTPWISVNWDNWLTSQLAVELAAKPEISTQLFMTNQEGVEVFHRVFSLNAGTQIVISTTDLQARIQQWIKRESLQNREHSHQIDSHSLHSRPNLPNNYVAPRNELEQTIANIWQEVLGIEQIGIHDNFLEIGGDSLLSIQITARANKAGLRITNQHLFEYPTIAQLAEVAKRTQTVLTEQGLVQGELPLVPIQHWFFEQNLLEKHHWNQAILLEAQQTLDPLLLEQIVQHLLVHHDALRLRFLPEKSGWKQVYASPNESVPFSQVDLSMLSQELQQQAIDAAGTKLQTTLNLSSGPLVRVALFDLGQQKPQRLLLVIHHLVVDVGSWRILLDDLQTAYQQLSQGKAVKFPPKTTSFKQWSFRLIEEYAKSIELEREQVYWLAASREWVSPLPVDYPGGANTVASAQTISVTLSVEETQALLEEVAKAYRVQIDDVLLTALVQATTKWTGTQSLLVDLEGNGRNVIFDDVDLSRTVGWFTNIAPVLLEIPEASQPGEALKVIKEQLHNFPNQGLGYGVLRYLSDDILITEKLRSLQQAEVIFLYLGKLEQSLPESSLFKRSQESTGSPRSLRGKRNHLLEINGLVVQAKLVVNWTYSENVHRRETVEGLANDFVALLRSLITNSQSPSVENFTPSDFAEFKESQWSQGDIDNILAAINESEDFAPY
ncbi:MAG: SDR family NAD(P)-dependent oxidoreductase, partial [Brasilonema sp.]